MEIIVKYRRKQFIILSLIFIFCASVIFIAEYRREKKILINNLNQELNRYSELLDNYILQQGIEKKISAPGIDSIVKIIPDKNQ